MSLESVTSIRLKPSPENEEQGARIGIFRRVAVERYVRPLESNVPEMLAKGPALLGVTGLGLLLWAGWLLS